MATGIAAVGLPIIWHEESTTADVDEQAAWRDAFRLWWQNQDKRKRGDKATRPKRMAGATAHALKKGRRPLGAKKWVEVRHLPTRNAGWLTPVQRTTSPQLATTLAFSQDALELAALNCGYGIGRDRIPGPYRSDGVWSDSRFARTMQLRTAFLLSTIDFAALRLHSFMDWHEISERGDVSFLLGGAVASLAAQAWLAGDGRSIDGFWHFGLYCAALVAGDTSQAFKNDAVAPGDKCPDYVVVDKKGDVHLFEAKGGVEPKSDTVVRDGLLQLSRIKQVTLHHGPTTRFVKDPLSRVVVRTIVDPTQTMSVRAYDPPGDGGESLAINHSVAHALQALESRDMLESATFSFRSTLDSGDMVLREYGGAYLILCANAPYGRLRAQVNDYLRVKEALPDGHVASTVVEADPGANGDAPWKRDVLAHVLEVLPRDAQTARAAFIQAVEEATSPSQVLLHVSEALEIRRTWSEFETVVWERSVRLRTLLSEWDVEMLPGRLIQLTEPKPTQQAPE